jgi:protein-S-isoprenylcysteine O-methyltransferase Ste14
MHLKFFILAAVFVVCVLIRDLYEVLKESRRINPENKVIFAGIFSVMCALWVSWFSLCPIDPYRLELPASVTRLALGIVIIGTALAVGALIQLRGVENIDHLVTRGLFKRMRHPMYLGFILWIVGWSIFNSSLVSLCIGIPGMVSVLWWRHLEDRRLGVQFGSAYAEYRKSTWF